MTNRQRSVAGCTCSHRLRLSFSAALLWLAGATAGGGEPLDLDETQGWVQESWTVDDGLPSNALTRVLQTRDGFLWIASYNGLLRFDGARFAVFRTAQVPALGSNRIIALEETGDGL